ncbi:MAG: BtpA/SgcQ family protein [Chlorobi bacterium]|nr:BtpA/SgcQ family protein [Chlorobiota bacterium]
MNYKDIFTSPKPIIACIHLMPLPGAPLYEGEMVNVFETALQEVAIFKKYNVDGLIVENFRDMPFYPEKLPPETIAAMTAVIREIRNVFPGPIGVNALRNDAQSAMAIAVATQTQFIRVNIHTGSAVTDQGLIHGKAHETLRLRANLKSDVLVFADVDVKHASPLGKRGLEAETRDLSDRGLANAIIVSGEGTGRPTRSADIEKVRQNTNLPILLGSGVNPDNIKTLSETADGFIVGSYFKKEGKAMNTVDEARVKGFMGKL